MKSKWRQTQEQEVAGFSFTLKKKKKNHILKERYKILQEVRFTLILGGHLETLAEVPHPSDNCIICLGIDEIRKQHKENVKSK